MNTYVKTMAIAAKAATSEMAKATSKQKNEVLKTLIEYLKKDKASILHANKKDIALAKANGLSAPLLERLSLENRLEGIIEDIEKVICLPDPIGESFDEQILPNGLALAKHRTPIGALGVIYESRPNVTLDISMLTIKSGNCVILRGGSETLYTNEILVKLIKKALVSSALPAEAVQLIANSDRTSIKELLELHEYIDLIIPRGSAALQQFCREHSKIPVITGGVGICHLFIDDSADVEKSLQVILNAKTQRPTVCNALDTLLVASSIASSFIPKVAEHLSKEGVTFRVDSKTLEIVQDATLATLSDFSTEWLSLVLGIKVVENLQEAIEHIKLYSTGHSDGILTEDPSHAQRFIREVDSAAVYVNASTRFTDGGQFGLGAEVAVSTQKLHARGPMGLKELTSYKWVVLGNYQVRT